MRGITTLVAAGVCGDVAFVSTSGQVDSDQQRGDNSAFHFGTLTDPPPVWDERLYALILCIAV